MTDNPNDQLPDALKEAYSRYRNPQYYNRDNGMAAPGPDGNLRLGPNNFTVSKEWMNDPMVRQQFQRSGATVHQFPEGQNQVMDVAVTPKGKSFWESPATVARYYNFLRGAPPGYQAPDWLDTQKVDAAYKYMRFRNNDRPWWEWKQLPEGDPGSEYLQSMQTPPKEFLLPTEQQYANLEPPKDVKPFGEWNNLRPWQQVVLGAFAPQTPGLNDRPEWTRATAALGQGLMAGAGAFALGSAIGTPIVGAALGLGVTAATGYQAFTGTEIPVLGQVLGLFNVPAQWLEQGQGLIAQASEDGGLQKVMANLPAAWEASKYTYEAGSGLLGPDLLNVVAQIAGDKPADAGQVWQIQKGLADPQTLQGVRGGAALVEARNRLSQGEDPATVYVDYVDRFGFSGTFTDFISQTVLDPMNMMPLAEGFAGEKIAKVIGKDRLAEAFKATRGNPLIDALPMGVQQLAEAVTGQHGSAGLFGALETYKNWIKTGYFPEGIKVTPASELSSFDKALGGLTKTGEIKELQPNTKTGVAGYLTYLGELTPESKAHVFMSTAQDNLNVVMSMAESDPEKMVNILKQAAGVTPVQVGDVGESLLSSPTTATIQGALREVVKTGVPDEMLASWQSGGPRRALLEKIGKALNETPADILQQMQDNPDVLVRRINQVAPALGTPDNLKQSLGVFVGDDPMPWNSNQFQAQLATSIFDKMDTWMVDHFGIKPDGAVMRASQVMKGMQSLLLLGFNPAYFINNQVNNMATRAAVGVFGYMTPGQIDGFVNRMGIRPERMDAGNAAAIESMGEPTGSAVGKAKRVDDAIGKAQKVVDAANDKLGIFSKFSSAGEKLESRQAFAIGMKRFWDQAWQPGRGMRRMDPALEGMLDRTAPGVKDAIYAAARYGMNMGEIETALYKGMVKPQMGAVLDEAARQINPEHPEIIRDILSTTGIDAELDRAMANATTPDQVDAAFRRVEERTREFVDELSKRALVTRAEEVQNLVAGERLPAVLSLYGDMEVKIAERWLNGRREWQDLYARKADMTEDQWSSEVKTLFAKQDADWRRTNDFEMQTYSGIIKALGIEGKGGDFIAGVGEIHENWKTFHAEAGKKRAAFFSEAKRKSKEPYAEYRARREVEWQKLQDELEELYDKHTTAERKIQEKLDNVFAQTYADYTKWDPKKAAAWRQNIRDRRYEMVQLQNQQRRATRNMLPSERDAAYAEFNPEYNRLIAEMKKAEIDGALELQQQAGNANTPAANGATPTETAAHQKNKIEQAVPEPAQPAPAQPSESDINAALAGSGPVVPQHVQNILGEALKAGITDRAGKPIAPYTLNIINKRQPEGQKYKSLADVPLDVAMRALEEHKTAHAHEQAQRAAARQLNAQDIIDIADQQAREAAISAAGMQSRRTVRQQLKDTFHANDAEVEAVMMLMDLHAERVNGKGESNRDAWYATHIQEITGEAGTGGLFQFQQTPKQAHPLADKALDYFGETQSIREAGYILPDGRMIDLSGKRDASGYEKVGTTYRAQRGQRDYLRDSRNSDHRDIGQVTDYGKSSPTEEMHQFMFDTGAIRIDYNAGLINITGPVTQAQARIIQEWFGESGWIEVDDPQTGRQIWNQEYDGAGQRKMRALLSEADAQLPKPKAAAGAGAGSLDDLRQQFVSGISDYYTGRDGNAFVALDHAMQSVFEMAGRSKTPEGMREILATHGFEKVPDKKIMEAIRYARELQNQSSELHQATRGSVSFLSDGRAVIRALQSPDISTMVHEVGHIFRRDLSSSDLEAVAKWSGLKDAAEFTDLERRFQDGSLQQGTPEYDRYVQAEEQFARGWERYLAEGDAPTPALVGVFQQFTSWLVKIYGNLKRTFGNTIGFEQQPEFQFNGKPVDIRATIDGVNIRDVFDRLLTADSERAPETVKDTIDDYLKTLPQTKAPTLSLPERQFINRPSSLLPDPVRNAIRLVAEQLMQDLNSAGSVVNKETHQAMREGGSSWYWSTYDAAENKSGIKRQLKNTLRDILAGVEDEKKPITQQVKTDILAMLTGEQTHDLGDFSDPATLWFMRKRDILFAKFRDNFEGATTEWLNKHFGADADQALTDYFTWASDHPTDAQPDFGTPISQRMSEAQAQESEVMSRFNSGDPVALDEVTGLTLKAGNPQPEPEAVTQARERILSGLSHEEQAYAEARIDYILGGYAGEEPNATLPIASMRRVNERVDADTSALVEHAIQQQTPTPVTEGAPGEGLQAVRVHQFKHGNYDIAATVYQDGKLVAYLPTNGDVVAPFDTNRGQAQLLGLDPNDPAKWVVKRGDEITSVDPEKPQLYQRNRKPAPGQPGLFTTEDLPLFSGTPMRAKDEVFNPRDQAQQDSLFNRADYLPGIEAKQAGGGVNGPLFEQAQTTPAISIEVKQGTIGLGKGKYAAFQNGEMLTNWFDNPQAAEADGARVLANRKAGAEAQAANAVELRRVMSGQSSVTETFAKKQFGRLDITIEQAGAWLREQIGGTHKSAQDWLRSQKLVSRINSDGKRVYDAVAVIETSRRYQAKESPQLFQDQSPTGSVPLGGTPATEPYAQAMDEIAGEHLGPTLRRMRESYTRKMGEKQFQFSDMNEQAQAGVRQWLNQVRGDMASTKLATMKYGEQMRDASLLNYSRRYGIDNILNLIAPYQFWYTRSMANWSKRMIDRPGWYAMYARLSQTQEKMERDGMPTRLKGQVRIPAPWLPEWAGGGLWIDPISKLMPMDSFGQPLEQFASNKNQVMKRTQTILQSQVKSGQITKAEMNDAIAGKNSTTWKRAQAQAEQDLDTSLNPVSMASMMLQPSLWWTVGSNLKNGTPEKISPLPITRTGQALKTATQGTALEGIGNLIGGTMAAPEEWARKQAGLSNFGEWGDYLVDRELANMAADGTAPAEAIKTAMIERSGALFDEANKRVAYQQMLRVPGATTLNQAAQGNAAGLVESLPTLFFGGGLFPEGELKLRGLQSEYSRAWYDYKQGDAKAIDKFLTDHPEYDARLALYDKPEDRLRQFLVSSIWDRYSALDKPNKRVAAQTLGQGFEDAFLNKETRSYDTMDVKQLAVWAQQLGQMLPKTPETQPAIDAPAPQPEYWQPEMSKAITAYQDQRNRLFPNYYAIQSEYYNLPAGSQRKAFMAQFPELKKYWDWNKQYKTQHPDLQPYFDAQAQAAPATLSDREASMISAPLARAVMGYALAGQKLTSGAQAELLRIMKANGKSMPSEEYAKMIMAYLSGQ